MDEAEIRAELERARSTYLRRDGDPRVGALYEPIAPGPLFTVQERDWLVAALLRRSGVQSLGGLDVLDVGCGAGVELQRLALWGAEPSRMAGVDLVEDRIVAARSRVPSATLLVGSAHALPFPSHSFDLVTQFTTFSSIMSAQVRSAAAGELLRVLRSTGRILWYDMRPLGRHTPDLHPISPAEMKALFPDCDIMSKPATLRWEVLRRIVPLSRSSGLALERLPFLNSHLIAVIRPRSVQARTQSV